MKKVKLNGYISKAYSEKNNDLQTHIEFVLTDFKPNANNQAISYEEAGNIIRTGLYQPFKIRFDGISETVHDRAEPVGPITGVWVDDSEERILARAVIWNESFPEVASYLIESMELNKPIGTSWEAYYADSEIDESGVEWLKGIVLSGTAAVKNPAYGSRTRLLAISEELYGVDMKQLEQKLAALEAEKAELLAKAEELEAKTAELESKAELLEAKASELEAEKAENELFSNRVARLKELGLDYTESELSDKRSFLVNLSDGDFDIYLRDLASLKDEKKEKIAEAEITKAKLPEPMGRQTIGLGDIAQFINEKYKR